MKSWNLLASLAALTGTISACEGAPAPEFKTAEDDTSPGESSANLGASPDIRTTSPVVSMALERLRSEPAPPDEVYAVVTITDRKTGEHASLVRGEPRPEYVDPASTWDAAGPGETYSETDSVDAEPEVLVVQRSIRRTSTTMPVRQPTRDEEKERSLAARNSGSGLSHRIEEGVWRRVSTGEIDLDSEQPVPVRIAMQDVPRLAIPKVDPEGTPDARSEARVVRSRAILERKQVMSEHQRGILAAIEDVGGLLRRASWMSGVVEATVPASMIPALADRVDVFSINYAETGRLAESLQGDDIATATDQADLEKNHPGTHGLAEKHPSTGRILIGLSDACIDTNSPAWRDDSNAASSRATFFDCDDGYPCPLGSIEACDPNYQHYGHGNTTASAAVADFMDGQYAPLTSAQRRQLTGACPECALAFFQDTDFNDMGRSMDQACEIGVDIYSLSLVAESSCDGNGSLDADVEALASCHVVPVVAAGNTGSLAGCTTTHPADHPWTFAVGGMGSQTPCDDPSDYYTANCAYAAEAAKGGGTYAGIAGAATIIDMTGPYFHGSLVYPGTAANPVLVAGGAGTSFATPAVAGLMGLMMDWYNVHIGSSIFYNNRMRAFFLLFGDRSFGAGGAQQHPTHVDTRWGAGRVGLVDFDSKAYWNLRRGSHSIAAGGTWTFNAPINPNTTFYKGVVWHDGTDYGSQPKLDFTVTPKGCSTPSQKDTSNDNKGVVAFDGAWGFQGCTSVDVAIKNVAQGGSGTRTYHFASYAETQNERSF